MVALTDAALVFALCGTPAGLTPAVMPSAASLSVRGGGTGGARGQAQAANRR
jgi:hypothetical protein